MEKDYSKSQLEDKALKNASLYFGQELLPYFNVGKRILRMLPTEQIRLEAIRQTEDILFEMDDATLAHFEFESVEVSYDDLRRFRVYDAYTAMRYKMPVITYVICSGEIRKIHSELKEGMNFYRVIPLQMKQRNADALFRKLKEKASENILTKEDFAPLLLTPLMAGESSVKDRILMANEILNRENTHISGEDKRCMEAVLYAFACKFLKRAELNEIKEAFSMTVLGEMIWSDGEKRGRSMKLIAQICLKLQKGKTPEQIADDLEEELTIVESICEIAKECGSEYNHEKIYQRFTEQKNAVYLPQ